MENFKEIENFTFEKFTFERFTLEDIPCIEEIIELNIEYAGRTKNVEKMIQWSIDHEEDLFRKIVDHNGTTIGYIGYDSAARKVNTRKIATKNDLYLEIYLHPEVTGKGLGCKIFKRSLEFLPLNIHKIYGSTYKKNIRAQRFLTNCGMKYLGSGVYEDTVLYVYDTKKKEEKEEK